VLTEIGTAFGYNQQPSYRGFTTSSAASDSYRIAVLRYNKKSPAKTGLHILQIF